MWDSFGLKQNPFDIKAVERYGIIPVSTFVGRTENRNSLERIVKTRSHSLSLIVGDRGIGKTSVGNVVRADLSGEYFVTISEIDSQHDWNSKDFILHTLGKLYETTLLVKTYRELPQKYASTCKEINQELRPLFEDESSSIGIEAAGFGFDRGSGRGLSRSASSFMRAKYLSVVNIVLKNGYRGVILQFNNLDNIEEEKKLSQVLADLRDFLVTDNCHYIFLGNKTMEACFKSNSKVNECVSSDVQLGPLDYGTIREILKKRYEAFVISGRTPIPPVSDEALETLYNLHEGNIRQIFYSLDRALVESERVLGKTAQLDVSSMAKVLVTVATDRIKGELQPRAYDVLGYILHQKREVTNTEITKKLKLKNQNTSKYLSQLKNNNLVVAVGKEGRKVYYKSVNEAQWLLLSPEKGVQTTLPD